MEKELQRAIESLICEITIPAWDEKQLDPTREIERRGYNRARTFYAESKILALKHFKELVAPKEH